MIPDPALQDYLKKDMTYTENKALAKDWHKYSYKKQPTSREQEAIQQGHDLTANMTSLQFNFFFSNRGNLLRRPGLGQRNKMWDTATDPEPYYEMSQVVHMWARNWAHIRATCESGGLTQEICRRIWT